MKGLYYYKLSSPYKEDQTKQCRLNINEIDSNFLNLKDADIANAELDNETKAIILTKNDGDKFVIDLKPLFDGSIYDLEVSRETPTENGGGVNVLIKYNTLTEDGEKVPTSVSLDNLVTVDMLKHGITNKVYTDGTITGDGTIEKPLAIASTERQIPAEALIDAIKGEKLPETPAVGQRYITKEYISDYGYLYNYDTAKEIQKSLDEDGFGWRIPTKEDWDCLLNSIEPCDYQDHNSTKCHIFLGKYAGKKLKSACGWEGESDCECKNTIPSADKVCKDNDDESDDETPIENHTPVNGGWGQYDTFSYTGGSITPNLNNFDNDGYALEFTFNPYLEYDQHFRRGWDEKKIVERLKNFATLTKVGYAKNYYVFKAHSHDDIPKIMDVADAAGLLIKVPFKHN